MDHKKPLSLNDYQGLRAEFAVYKSGMNRAEWLAKNGNLLYTVLALAGEAGELANKLKKFMRSNTDVDTMVLADELGDNLWYVSAIAAELNMTLEEVADMNLTKLKARKAMREAA